MMNMLKVHSTARTQICVHVCAHVFAHVRMLSVYLSAHRSVCMPACTHACVHACTRACTHVCTNVCTHVIITNMLRRGAYLDSAAWCTPRGNKMFRPWNQQGAFQSWALWHFSYHDPILKWWKGQGMHRPAASTKSEHGHAVLDHEMHLNFFCHTKAVGLNTGLARKWDWPVDCARKENQNIRGSNACDIPSRSLGLKFVNWKCWRF